MTVDIDANLKAFLADRIPGARYASFDYCFNYFQEAYEAGETARLADKDHLLLSCLQLGFFLASWGMMRGSADLLQRSVRELLPVVEVIAQEPKATWSFDVQSYTDDADFLLALGNRIRKAFTGDASDILVTKTMLGVFGCVPAFDRYFRIGFKRIGFKCSTLCKNALTRINEFYKNNKAEIDAVHVSTLDFTTGNKTGRLYSRAKIVDMVCFQEGVSLKKRNQPHRQA